VMSLHPDFCERQRNKRRWCRRRTKITNEVSINS